jgi:hypothetical protein
MKYWPFFLFISAIVFITAPVYTPSAGTNSCVTCHTDDAKLKSLVKPPKIGGAGEG